MGDVPTCYCARCRVWRGATAFVRYVFLPHQRPGKIFQRSQRCGGAIQRRRFGKPTAQYCSHPVGGRVWQLRYSILGYGGEPSFCCRKKIGELLGAEFAKLGLALENFTVESISLPASIQAALDKKISMGVIGDLGRYTQYQTAESIPLAAQNEGGLAGIGAGLGVGAGIGQAMAGAMSGMMQPNAQQAQQNAQPVAEDPQAKLLKLKSLLDGGLISQEDFDKAKAEVLKQLIG